MKYGDYLDQFLAGKPAKKIELYRYENGYLVGLSIGHERKSFRKFKNFRAAKKLVNKLAKKHPAAFIDLDY